MEAAASCGGGAIGDGVICCLTGDNGFIGSWLVHHLLDRGLTVHATVKNLRAYSSLCSPQINFPLHKLESKRDLRF
jgi:nucleoside-diphosphate-sugar epimerase